MNIELFLTSNQIKQNFTSCCRYVKCNWVQRREKTVHAGQTLSQNKKKKMWKRREPYTRNKHYSWLICCMSVGILFTHRCFFDVVVVFGRLSGYITTSSSISVLLSHILGFKSQQPSTQWTLYNNFFVIKKRENKRLKRWIK